MEYKISIGSNIVDGPWGGGNQFAMSLRRHLMANGWQVIDNLNDNDIDLIVMTEPRKNLLSCKYNQLDIANYVKKHPDTVVVHRINECDERKATRNVNAYLKRANQVADHTVFISDFLKRLFIDGNIFQTGHYSVIRNGADKRIFNMDGRARWNGDESLRLVTHHWGGNYYKGFDIYEYIDSLVKDKEGLEKDIVFTYIGNLPDGFKFKNSEYTRPLEGIDLAMQIKENHIYVTASINEPAGMHHIEGGLCGLPLLFRNSGGIPEYAEGFGLSFQYKKDFLKNLNSIIKDYDNYFNKMEDYPYDSELMCRNYEKLFIKLLQNRKNLDIKARKRKYSKIFFKERFLLKTYKGDN